MLKWKRDTLGDALRRLRVPAILAGIGIAAILAFVSWRSIFAAFGIGLAVWLVAGSLALLVHRLRLFRVLIGDSLNLARTTPLAFYGLVIAHAGLGLTILGITGISAWSSEKVLAMRPGEITNIAGYDIRFVSMGKVRGPNYIADQGRFDVIRGGRVLTQFDTERRFFDVRQQQTTVAGIRTNLAANVYVAVGEPDPSGTWAVRLYHHPLAAWIWLGAIIMALGGFVSLADRRFRIGAPQRAQRASALAAASPAE